MNRVRDETEIYSNYLLSEFDELNSLYQQYVGKTVDQNILDEIIGYLIFMYVNGARSVALMTRSDKFEEPDAATISNALYQPVDGKDVIDRLEEYIGCPYESCERDIDVIVRTEGHRLYILGQMEMARQIEMNGEKLYKRWDTTLDGKSRNTHFLLNNTVKKLDEYFETVNGKSKAPGQFGIPEEDCNCRCILRYERK